MATQLNHIFVRASTVVLIILVVLGSEHLFAEKMKWTLQASKALHTKSQLVGGIKSAFRSKKHHVAFHVFLRTRKGIKLKRIHSHKNSRFYEVVDFGDNKAGRLVSKLKAVYEKAEKEFPTIVLDTRYTQALLSAVPSSNPNKQSKRILLQGDVPSPMDPPSGSAFHPRCQAKDKPEPCFKETPVLATSQNGNQSACHLT